MEFKAKLTTLSIAELEASCDPSVGLDLGAHTQGWHDEWMWTPEYWKMQGLDSRYTSNLPNIDGLGNNGYRSMEQWMAHFVQTIITLRYAAARGENLDTTKTSTEAYACLEGDTLSIYEFWIE